MHHVTPMQHNSEKALKEIVINFLKLASKGNSRQAFTLYSRQDFKHHNVYFKGDANTLMLAMEGAAKKNPDKVLEVHRALQDGNLVAVHCRVRKNPNDLGNSVMYIFRFEQNKIVELWDVGQAVPSETVNENGMF